MVPRLRDWAIAAALLAVVLAERAPPALACPFCKALGPTLAQLRQQASVAALVELETQTPSRQSRLRLHRVFVGAERLQGTETLDVALDAAGRPGGLLLVFGNGPPDAPPTQLAWHAVSVNENSYAYFARAPSPKSPAAERLRYFAPFLEHADPLIAEDAYLEFGHATFGEVASVADVLPLARMRGWLTDPKVPPERKGFYGLALGLTRDPGSRRAGALVLRQLILAPEDDFRAGFDGIIGGYLLLAGREGLQLVETQYLANPRAADGDVRHAMAALRFYHEYGRDIPPARLQSALRHVLARPEFAAAAVTDLARWQDWSALERVVALYTKPGYSDPAIRRAIVGYLLACPERQANEALARLRQVDPQGVAAAEQVLSRTLGVAPAEQ
jgi:hypothetical protein